MDFEVLKEVVFKNLCNSAVAIMNIHTALVSVPYLANRLQVSKYMVRKAMDELRKEGLVESGIDSWYDSWCEEQILARGFRITQKAKETEIYKAALTREEELISECFK